MKLKSRVRQSVSQVYDVLIPEGKWNEYSDMLDKDGHPNRRELCSLILVFGKHIEQLEDLIEDLYFQLELAQNSEAERVSKPDLKLQTTNDIQAELDTVWTPELTEFYVSKDDWSILEKGINPQLAKTNYEYGYGKETNPKTDRIEVCLYYRELPVFKK